MGSLKYYSNFINNKNEILLKNREGDFLTLQK